MNIDKKSNNQNVSLMHTDQFSQEIRAAVLFAWILSVCGTVWMEQSPPIHPTICKMIHMVHILFIIPFSLCNRCSYWFNPCQHRTISPSQQKAQVRLRWYCFHNRYLINSLVCYPDYKNGMLSDTKFTSCNLSLWSRMYNNKHLRFDSHWEVTALKKEKSNSFNS